MSASERAAAVSSAYRQAYGGSSDVPADVLPYLATLRRLPDEVVLDMATREFDLSWPEQCLCGWAVREALAKQLGIDPADVDRSQTEWALECTDNAAARLFGGTMWEWGRIFGGVTRSEVMPLIELAFLLRVAEAAE